MSKRDAAIILGLSVVSWFFVSGFFVALGALATPGTGSLSEGTARFMMVFMSLPLTAGASVLAGWIAFFLGRHRLAVGLVCLPLLHVVFIIAFVVATFTICDMEFCL
ncbi:MAG: hypothetical protein QNJ30_26505 [Kiloniellales bacterium]|nr:hypothetical protein [Kiloniellales bacterium]